MSTPLTDDSAPGWAVRLEAKMDVLLGKHDARITSLESSRDDHERRLRHGESQNYVTPKGLVAAMTSAVGLTTGFIVLIERLTS